MFPCYLCYWHLYSFDRFCYTFRIMQPFPLLRITYAPGTTTYMHCICTTVSTEQVRAKGGGCKTARSSWWETLHVVKYDVIIVLPCSFHSPTTMHQNATFRFQPDLFVVNMSTTTQRSFRLSILQLLLLLLLLRASTVYRIMSMYSIIILIEQSSGMHL